MNERQCTGATAWTCRQPALWQDPYVPHDVTEARAEGSPTGIQIVIPVQSFVPGVVAHYMAHQDFPITRELAVVFVDLAHSTRVLAHQPPAQALALLQRFTEIVTEGAVAHCGDVKDYEGDGALLYFATIANATRAVLAIRTALAALQTDDGEVLQARFSLNVGEVTIGVIGSTSRRSVALIGPTVTLAARLLKHVAPGGIIAPQTVVERLQQDAPSLARDFQLQGTCLTVRDFEEQCVTAYSLLANSPESTQPRLASCVQGRESHHGQCSSLSLTEESTPKGQNDQEASGWRRETNLSSSYVSSSTSFVSSFRRDGDYWTLSFAGTTCHLKDALGLHYIAHLLRTPHQEVHVVTLLTASVELSEEPTKASHVQDTGVFVADLKGGSDAIDIFDPRARVAYKQRLHELREELDEAQQRYDFGRSEQLAEEIDFLTHELASAVGLGGRARRMGSPAERARVNITRAIKIALRKISEHHPALAQHLATTIKTGAYCSYTPDTRLPIIWQV